MSNETIENKVDENNPKKTKLPGEIWHEKNAVPIINWNDKISSSLNNKLGSRSLGLFPTK